MTESKQVDVLISQGKIALKENGTLAAVQAAMVEPYHADAARTENVPFPAVPAPVVITDEAKKALRRLPDVFAVVQPTERRTLSQEEMEAVHAEREVLKQIVELLAGRDEDLKTIIRHHMDVDAEERGVAVPKAVVDQKTGQVIVEATDRDSKGNYILCGPGNPERVRIPGTNTDWSREYRKGSLTTDPSVIESLLEEGTISRDVYLAMTREQRVFDPNKAMEAAATKPDLRDGVLTAIKAMTRVGKPSTSLFVRKAK